MFADFPYLCNVVDTSPYFSSIAVTMRSGDES